MDLSPGSVLGPYRIEGTLGRGGMGVVYRAYEESLARHVALKVLPPALLHEPVAERFRREARLAARLEHPHIVPIYAYGIEDGRPWMALRLVDGGSLAGLLEVGRLEPSRAVALLRDVADALDHAHGQGVIHRDVKPQNILLDEHGRAYLADFGIAKLLASSTHVTATGMIQGTPAYMAPEQVEGKTLGPSCDVYALGIVAYECLAGRVPFRGSTPVSVLVKQVNEPAPLPSPAEVAPPLTGALHRCLAKEPTDRWPSADTFVDALERGLAGGSTMTLSTPGETPAPGATSPAPDPAPTVTRRRLLWGGGVTVVAAVVLLLGGLALRWAATDRPAASAPSPTAAAFPTPATTTTPAAPSTPSSTPPPRPTATPERPTPAPPPRPEPVVSEATARATPAEAEPTPEAESTPEAVTTPQWRPIRVYCAAQLEPRLHKKTKQKDVADSTKDLRGAFADREGIELVDSPTEADAIVLVLERGWKKTLGVPGRRQVRVRVTAGQRSFEILGQDSTMGFNTWKGAARGAAKQAEEWLQATLATPGAP